MSAAAALGSVALIHLLAMISPGPNVLVVVQTAMARARGPALAVAAGVATGSLLLSAGAALGLGLLIQDLAWLHRGIQVVGGAYLLYLGVRIFLGARAPMPAIVPGRVVERDLVRFWRRGLLTNLTNPKAAVFFGSILTGALDPGLPTWVRVAAVLVITVNAVWWHCLLAVSFARPRVQRGYGKVKTSVDRVVGAGLGLLGIRLATSA